MRFSGPVWSSFAFCFIIWGYWSMPTPDFAIIEVNKPVFCILQITDLHSDVEERLNERTREDIRAMVAAHRPDLLAVTGDVWCAEERPETARMWRQRDLDFLGSLDTPWAFTWGNHDFVGDWEEASALIAATPNVVAPPGDGHGNFRVEVRRGGSGAARPAWDLFFINSGPQWRLPDDLTWFESEVERVNAARGRVVPAAVFFHIPTGNYQAAIDEGRAIGFGSEEVLNWGDDDGLAADILKRAGRSGDGATRGNVRACFCGHSHKNDFHFAEEDVVFAYGRATGYGGYGGEDLRKGAKRIDLDLVNGGLTFQTIFANAGISAGNRYP